MSARDRVARAILDEGPAPFLHRKLMARHRREWPTLWSALDALVAEAGAPDVDLRAALTKLHAELEAHPVPPVHLVTLPQYDALKNHPAYAVAACNACAVDDDEADTDAHDRLQSIADIHAAWTQGSMDVVTMATEIGRVLHS